MTELLTKVFEQVAHLPAEEQDAFARLMLEELESEEKWIKLFADSQEALGRAASDIREEIQKGTIQPLDPDKL